jgi:hypothetical protein
MDRRIKPTAVRLSDSGDTKIVIPAKRPLRDAA